MSAGQKASVVGMSALVAVLGVVVLIGAFGSDGQADRPADGPATAVSALPPAPLPG